VPNRLLIRKVARVLGRKTNALLGRFYSLDRTLQAMAARPYELHLELTNLCNANCVFCPYQYQTRETQFMSDEVFHRAVGDFMDSGGGSVGLTPIVGDALIDPKFLERVRYIRSFPQADRVWVTTNAILLDKHGVDTVLDSGLTSMTISTAGFEEEMYRRVYRNSSYQRMRRNVLDLLAKNHKRQKPIPITIGLRPDRPLDEVMRQPDFAPILAYEPELDFTWSYTSANGRITRESLPEVMRLRVVASRSEPCVSMYNGPIVLPDGTVLACSCVAAMDAIADLSIGNILKSNLLEIWASPALQQLRSSFGTAQLNRTCASCDMYRGLELYRMREGRERARVNQARHDGQVVHRGPVGGTPFQGG